jgi:hypothetical protein
MKTMHSLSTDLLIEIARIASTELLRCDTDFDEEEIAELALGMIMPAAKLYTKEITHCLLKAAEGINKSGLMNGYEVTVDEVIGIIFMWPMVGIILENVPSDMDTKQVVNFFYDIADLAGYHLSLHSSNAFSEDSLAHFNSKLPQYFTHTIEGAELSAIGGFYAFGANYLEYQYDPW